MSGRIPNIVIVGRPNVGKSTLFNRLFGRKRALVHDLPGVTRDRLEERAEWMSEGRAYPVLVVDTGGLGGDRFAEEIARQVDIALSSADIVLMLFDGRAGLTSADEDVVRQLKSAGLRKPIVGIVNKVDAEQHEELINEFYAADFEHLVTVSAEHNRGIDDLQRLIVNILGDEFKPAAEAAVDEWAAEAEAEAELEATDSEDSDSEPGEEIDLEDLEEIEDEVPAAEERRIPRIAIVGRPNVGKSTLVNAILGEERMIASPIAGTTIDAVDSEVELEGRKFILIDTAGIRRKSKTEQGVEVLSVVQARKALERCDIAILLLDGETGITDQDEKIGGIIEEVGCGVILGLNKWDTQRKNPKFTRELAAERVRKEMAYLRYAPILFTSGKERKGFDKLADLVDEMTSQRRIKISTKDLTTFIRDESRVHNPANVKFYMSHQTGRTPPTFVCHVSNPDKVDFSLRRHFVNAMRERWGYMGSPIRIHFIKPRERLGPRRKRDPLGRPLDQPDAPITR